MELAVGHVERDHRGGAALEQAVGEAAGGGAHVEAEPALGLDAERVERVRELHPAARDERGRPRHGERRRPRPRAGRAWPPGRSPTCTSPAITAAAARERRLVQPALGEQRVESALRHRAQSVPRAPRAVSDAHTGHPPGGRSLECVTLARLISPSLRSGLLMLVGTGADRWLRSGFGLGAAAGIDRRRSSARSAWRSPWRAPRPSGRGTIPLSAQAVYDRGLAVGLVLVGRRLRRWPARSGAMALFGVAGVGGARGDLDHPLQRERRLEDFLSQITYRITPPSGNGPASAGPFLFGLSGPLTGGRPRSTCSEAPRRHDRPDDLEQQEAPVLLRRPPPSSRTSPPTRLSTRYERCVRRERPALDRGERDQDEHGPDDL